MRKLAVTLILLSIIIGAQAQRKLIDSLRAKLNTPLEDSTRIKTMLDLCRVYYIQKPDSNIILSQQAYELAEKNKFQALQARALNDIAIGYTTFGDYPRGIQMFRRSLRISESIHDIVRSITVSNNLSDTYSRQGDYRKALNYLLPAEKQLREYKSHHKITGYSAELTPIIDLNIGEVYLDLGKIDSADYYLQKSHREAEGFVDLLGNTYRDFGEVEIARGHTGFALKYLGDAIRVSKANDDQELLSKSYLSKAKLYRNNQLKDSAEFYAQKALEIAAAGKFQQAVLDACKRLYTYYDEDHNLPQAYKYFRLATTAKDSLYSQEKVKQILSLDFEEKQRQREIAAAQEQYRDSVRMYALICGLVVLLLLAIIFWRNNKRSQKAKTQIQATLDELKITQDQLVQSAKMASLGELTAGIAHEIQNPLNFVNNFSEVNTELIDELQQEIEKGNPEEVKAIAADIKENQRKISQHGKRADFIVKGMLEHSRSTAGERQLTNINILADEFFKLSYHGGRAKDKSFNVGLITNFDPNLPKANIAQQDIGRVLLNLFNNAFYAVNQKQKTAGPDYKPEVSVTTLTEHGQVIIKVKDNGTGIPDAVKEKIMQPFFTTKPAGEGTGLGLSLTYDMVVKGHGGSIRVDTREGEYTEFTVSLPIS